jgi:putative PIN family toxin of toxin-antitoxin system
MQNKNSRVIFDTNVWISFLIGKRLSSLKNLISNGQISIIIRQQLLDEINDVTSRERIKKHFQKQTVQEFIELLKNIAEHIDIVPTHFISRDPKDNFLLDLIDFSKADYLVTGDKDLLEHTPFKTAIILTPAAFEDIIAGK